MKSDDNNSTYGLYTEQDGYVFRYKGNAESNVETVRLSNFTVVPLFEITKDDGTGQTKSFSFNGKMFDGTPLRKITVSSEKFAGMNWIEKEWGLSPTISPSQTSIGHFKNYIKTKALGIPKITIYTHTGFRTINGELCYLHKGGAIGNSEVQTELESELGRYCFVDNKKDISKKEAVKADFELLGIGLQGITYPILAFMYLAPLAHFLDKVGYIPSFSLYVKGETGSLKTAISNLFMAHFYKYKPFNGGVANFGNTYNYIEKLSFTLKDMPLFIDDYHPGNLSDKKKMDSIAQHLSRGAGHHAGRGRMNSDATLKKTFYSRGVSLITGEESPDIGQSGLARFFFVNVKQGNISIDRLKAFNGKAELLNIAMQGYIKWLIDRADTLPEKLAELFRMYQESVDIKGAHVVRLCATGSVA